MKQVTILFVIACVLAYVCQAQGECCQSSTHITYTVGNGSCGDAGGYESSKGCEITICPDGRVKVGTWCGRGSCNLFGCACKNGCLTGDRQNSFLNNFKHLNIKIIDVKQKN